ncbi:platelet glycoprotein 4 [Sinocyclocheilus rhinocerous]|uniref:Platelet glycoprotein 4 n=1 Tax=Sinocyclocheilus rhinocerous TaxID=307959 RepID=A0A673GC60_9TELE|nr:PREDICTED: platelet glycoprotein 4 [Sinocyclocheilus rhinocerous]
MTCCDLKCGLITGTVLGALIAVLGGILIPVGNMFIENTVHNETVLENGTLAFDTWTSVDIAVYRQFWLFDVQNPDDVVSQGAKPVLVQKGPYTYRTRFIPKKNITFNDNYTVSFVLPAGAIFEPSMSVGTEEDIFTSLNLAVAGVYGLLGHRLANWLIQRSNSTLFQNRTVKELLWGYKDPMLGSMLGVFYPYNDTIDGPYTVFTGKDDINKVATIERWQGETSLSYWNDSYCNKINGTDGSSFHPFLDKKEPLYFFSSDICRSISAKFDRTVDLKGISVYRYLLPPEALASPVENPDNQCYCTDPVLTKNCTTAGLLDLTACRGAPVFLSLPHFLYGSNDLHQGVIGLNPNFDEHSIFLDVEPITGFTLRFAKRLQLNMLYGPSDSIVILNKIKDYTIFPILWVNETAVLDDETADMFKKELIARMELLEGFQIGLIVVGLILFASCLIGLIVVCTKPNNNKLSLVVK